jgi:hypothetical protein
MITPRLLLTGLLLLACCGACQDDRQPIVVTNDKVTVTNLSDAAWTDVEVWLNDHYRVQAPALAPGQRLDVPIRVFIAGFGQRFDPKRQAPFGVEVDARDPQGKPVRLIWRQGRRR